MKKTLSILLCIVMILILSVTALSEESGQTCISLSPTFAGADSTTTTPTPVPATSPTPVPTPVPTATPTPTPTSTPAYSIITDPEGISIPKDGEMFLKVSSVGNLSGIAARYTVSYYKSQINVSWHGNRLLIKGITAGEHNLKLNLKNSNTSEILATKNVTVTVTDEPATHDVSVSASVNEAVITPNEEITITLNISGTLPSHYTFRYDNNGLTCGWKSWISKRSCPLTVKSADSGKFVLDLWLFDTETGLVYSKVSVPVYVSDSIVNIPPSVTSIHSKSFDHTSAEIIIIPESCTYVAPDAFSNCDRLKYIINHSALSIVPPDGVSVEN